MAIEIRRWHVLIAVCAGLLLARAAIFSKETRPTLTEAIKPVLKAEAAKPADGGMSKFASRPPDHLPGTHSGSPPIADKLHASRPYEFRESRSAQGAHELAPAPSLGASSHRAQWRDDLRQAPLRNVGHESNLNIPPLKTLALTFDDGPHPGHTERLLKVLRDSKVRATFFVVGKQVERYPGLLEMIVREGHEIGNHTYYHPDMRKLSPAEMAEELEKTEHLVYTLTGKKMKYFRPPGGQYNPAVAAAAKAQGYEMVLWSVLPQDHTRPSSSLIRSRVLESSKSGGIVLLHSGVESTLDTLPGLIHTLKDRGFKFKTVSQIRGTEFHPQIARTP